MNAWSITLFILAACLLSLSGWMLQRYQRSAAIAAYGGFLIALASITVIQAILFLHPSLATTLLLTRLGYFAGVVTFSLLLLFSWHFPIPSARIPKQANLFWLLPIVFFLPLTLFSPNFLKAVTWTDGLYYETFGHTFWLFLLFTGLYSLWAILNLVGKSKYVQGSQQKNMQRFIWVLVLATLTGFVSDVLLPALGRPRVPISVYTSAVLFGVSAYIVTRK